jgi:hypothetical protein
MYRIKPVLVLLTESDLRSATPLVKRVIGGMGLNTACWSPGKTYSVSPIPGLVVSTFLQPGGSTALGYTVSWAAENALDVAIRIIVTFILPNDGGRRTVSMSIRPGDISTTLNWQFPAGSTNFQLAATTID